MSKPRGDAYPIAIPPAGGQVALDLRLLHDTPDPPDGRPFVARSHNPRKWYLGDAAKAASTAPQGRTSGPRRVERMPARRKAPADPTGLLRPPVDDDEAWLDAQLLARPRTRGDCLPGGSNEARPCPWVGCKYHLYLDASEATGTLTYNTTGEVEDMRQTCALDVADAVKDYERTRYDCGAPDGMELRVVGELMGMSRQWVQKIEDRALERLRAVIGIREDWLDE